MERHNEKKKMDLRLRAEENHKAAVIAKGLAERAEMQNHSKRKFWIWVVGRNPLQFRSKTLTHANSFQVSLCKSLSIEEINARMMKAFGDI